MKSILKAIFLTIAAVGIPLAIWSPYENIPEVSPPIVIPTIGISTGPITTMGYGSNSPFFTALGAEASAAIAWQVWRRKKVRGT